MINNRAVQIFGFDSPESAVGDYLYVGGDRLEVVGVVADYHQQGLQEAYLLVAFRYREAPRSYLSMKVGTADLQDRWLDGFAFRIGIPLWTFVAAIALAVLIALATVSYESLKVAAGDPVKSLRYE